VYPDCVAGWARGTVVDLYELTNQIIPLQRKELCL